MIVSSENCVSCSVLFTSYCLHHGCANHDTEGKPFKFPHPLLWRNEASLLDQWRTKYFPLALFAYTVCCRRTEQCFSVLRTPKSDVVDGSSGRRYVTDQCHNVPLLRGRGLDASLRNGHTDRHISCMRAQTHTHTHTHTHTNKHFSQSSFLECESDLESKSIKISKLNFLTIAISSHLMSLESKKKLYSI